MTLDLRAQSGACILARGLGEEPRVDISLIDQYFELALDLPPRERERLLARIEAEDPRLGRNLRDLLAGRVTNPDFACQTGTGGARATTRDRMHHVAVQVGDVAAAVDWYLDRFACEVEYRDETWALLRFDGIRLALVVPEQHPPHIALCRTDARDFGELKQHRDGTRSVYIEDPWGNAIEVLEGHPGPSVAQHG